jgi:hypothetical protein
VPGCSHRATHSHHICIHGGYLRVFGRAPAALTWFLNGKVRRGPVGQGRPRASTAPAPTPA